MKLIFLLSVLLFWGACKSSPVILRKDLLADSKSAATEAPKSDAESDEFTDPDHSGRKPKEIYKPTFHTFNINKILESGIHTVEIKPGVEWPKTKVTKTKSLKSNAKKLRLLVIGDSGCRLKEGKGRTEYQNCLNSKEWPFPELVKKASEENFDFAVHTGDYHYREQCSDEDRCEFVTKSAGDNWPAWWDDFYGPMQPLFKKAPLLLMRGNHEECDRAYRGWQPLNPHDKGFDSECKDIENTQIIEMNDLVIVNFDNSNFQDKQEMEAEHKEKYLKELKKVSKRLGQIWKTKEVWLMTHKPVLGYFPDKSEDLKVKPITQNMLMLLKEAGLAEKIHFVLSGHIHNNQLVPSEKGPVQLIIGNSGTTLDPIKKEEKPQDLNTSTWNFSNFGYTILQREGFKKWSVEFKDLEGEVSMKCQIDVVKVTCS